MNSYRFCDVSSLTLTHGRLQSRLAKQTAKWNGPSKQAFTKRSKYVKISIGCVRFKGTAQLGRELPQTRKFAKKKIRSLEGVQALVPMGWSWHRRQPILLETSHFLKMLCHHVSMKIMKYVQICIIYLLGPVGKDQILQLLRLPCRDQMRPVPYGLKRMNWERLPFWNLSFCFRSTHPTASSKEVQHEMFWKIKFVIMWIMCHQMSRCPLS